MVTEAQRSRAPIQKLVGTVSGYFVLAVIVSAVLSFITWALFAPEPAMAYAMVNAVAVLIIACPFALGLATLMSIMVGTGKGAQNGILIKDAEALEFFEKVKTIVVDKTDTLTVGKPKLVTIQPNGELTKELLFTYVGAVKTASEHPLAHAIVQGAMEREVRIENATYF